MLPIFFNTARRLANKTNAYFRRSEGSFHFDGDDAKGQKFWDREPEPATLAGLAHFIGFESRRQLEEYEQNGEFGHVIRRCRLRIEAIYEKKLHQQSSAGAVFALKNMGWNGSGDERRAAENQVANLTIEIIESGPGLASREEEIAL